MNTVAYNHVGRDATRTEMVAVRRAARRLAEDGRARAIYLGQCRRCGELSERWVCRLCGSGCAWVLVLTNPDGPGAAIKSLLTTHRHRPGWLSVASGADSPGATLTGRVADAGS